MLVVLVRVSVRWRVYLVMGYSVLGHVVAACGGQRRYIHKKHPMSPTRGEVRECCKVCPSVMWQVAGSGATTTLLSVQIHLVSDEFLQLDNVVHVVSCIFVYSSKESQYRNHKNYRRTVFIM